MADAMSADQPLQDSASEIDRFLSCTNCGWAFPIDSMFEDERCYQCDGVLAVRVLPEEAER
jgi:hypothetical protein